MITLTSWNISSSRADGVFIEGLTTLTAVAVVASDLAIATAEFLITKPDGTTQTVTPTESPSETWTYSMSTTTPGDYQIALRFTDADANRLQGFAKRFSVKAHTAPTITYNVFRCDSNGDLDLQGGYLSVTAWANSNPVELGLNGGIVLDGDFQEGDMASGVAYIVGSGTVDPDTDYTIRFEVEDNASLTTSDSVDIYAVDRIINIEDGGTGIALLKNTAVRNATLTVEDESYPPSFQFGLRGDDPTRRASVLLSTQTVNAKRVNARLQLRQYSYNSTTGAVSSNYESYRLPLVDADMAASETYNLVTDKGATTATLAANGWSSNTQTVAVTGVTSSSLVIVSPAPSSMSAYQAAGIYCSAQGTNSLTFTCSTVPTAAITVNVLIVG